MRRLLPVLIAAVALAVAAAPASANRAKHIDHIVVVFEENHSFDNLYGGWEGVTGLGSADARTRRRSLRASAHAVFVPAAERRQPHLAAAATRRATLTSHFTNAPFKIEDYIPPTAKTCPAPGVFAQHGVLAPSGLEGGCTEDLVHRYYQEQYQLDGGRQDRYVTGSDAVGLTMGTYDTQALPIYAYLHGKHHPNYVDRRPLLPERVRRLVPQPPVADRRAHADLAERAERRRRRTTCTRSSTPNGMPTSYPLYARGPGLKDQQLTASCTAAERHAAAGRRRLRRLRGQHDAAALPAIRPRHRRRGSSRRRRRRRSATG